MNETAYQRKLWRLQSRAQDALQKCFNAKSEDAFYKAKKKLEDALFNIMDHKWPPATDLEMLVVGAMVVGVWPKIQEALERAKLAEGAPSTN